jgi:hypothetical protein
MEYALGLAVEKYPAKPFGGARKAAENYCRSDNTATDTATATARH